jgi:hypothetical protein
LRIWTEIRIIALKQGRKEMAITIEKDGLFWKVKDGNKTLYKSK